MAVSSRKLHESLFSMSLPCFADAVLPLLHDTWNPQVTPGHRHATVHAGVTMTGIKSAKAASLSFLGVCRALAVVGSPSTLKGSAGIWRDWLSWVDHFQAAVDDSVLPACPFEPAQQNASSATASTMSRQSDSRQENSRRTSSERRAGSSSPSLPLESGLNQHEQPAAPQAQSQATPSSRQNDNQSTHTSQPQAIMSDSEAGMLSEVGQSQNGHMPNSAAVGPSAPQLSERSDGAESKKKQKQLQKSEDLPSATSSPKRTRKRPSK